MSAPDPTSVESMANFDASDRVFRDLLNDWSAALVEPLYHEGMRDPVAMRRRLEADAKAAKLWSYDDE